MRSCSPPRRFWLTSGRRGAALAVSIAPPVEELATEYDGKLKVGKLNVDDHPAIAQNYGITGIPALLFFKDGKRVDTVVGAVSKDVLQDHVKGVVRSA